MPALDRQCRYVLGRAVGIRLNVGNYERLYATSTSSVLPIRAPREDKTWVTSGKRTAVWGRASQTAVGGESESWASQFLGLPVLDLDTGLRFLRAPKIASFVNG